MSTINIKPVRRISPAVLLGEKSPKVSARTYVGRVGGVVYTTETVVGIGASEAIKLVGQFVAVGADGSAYRSKYLYLPDYFASEVALAMPSRQGAGLKIGGYLYVTPSKGPVGYQWEYVSTEEIPVEVDIMEALLPPETHGVVHAIAEAKAKAPKALPA